MKYALESLIVIVLFALGYLIYSDQNSAKYDTKMAQFEKRFDSLQTIGDSVTIIEKSVTKKLTVINHYYDSTKTIIYNLSDSAQFDLLRANLIRFEYLLEFETSENH
jgi:hypothetical protein